MQEFFLEGMEYRVAMMKMPAEVVPRNCDSINSVGVAKWLVMANVLATGGRDMNHDGLK
jgi:hypothetical protein